MADIIGGPNDDFLTPATNYPSTDTIDGGEGFDTLVLKEYAPQSVYFFFYLPTPDTSVSHTFKSVEAIRFDSTSGHSVTGLFGFAGSLSGQFGVGAISATARIAGDAGTDNLYLYAGFAGSAPYTVTMPSFTYVDWTTPSRAYLGDGDAIVLTLQATEANGTINASPHAGVMVLQGSDGDDVINGSADMDYLYLSAGQDELYGNGGDDVLSLTYFWKSVSILGNPPISLFRTGAGDGAVLDGGAGSDFLRVAGSVEFRGQLQNIEGIYLVSGLPTEESLEPEDTLLWMQASQIAGLTPSLEMDGKGSIAIEIGDDDANQSFNASGYVFTPGADVTIGVVGSGADNIIVGTSHADYVTARAGNDSITGGGGDDLIDGGEGTDVVFFADAFADCTITFEANVVTVTTKTQGVDRLTNVETMNFAGSAVPVVFTPDGTLPTVVITDDQSEIIRGDTEYTLTFSEAVFDVDIADFTTTSGYVDYVEGSGTTWKVHVIPEEGVEGTISFALKADSVFDISNTPVAATATPTRMLDTLRPDLIDVSPAFGEQTASVNSNIVLTYSQAVHRGDWPISLWRRTSGGGSVMVEEFASATSDRISISGAKVTIDPTQPLAPGEEYFLLVPGVAFLDSSGNWSSWLDQSRVSFTTAEPLAPVFTSDGLKLTVGDEVLVMGTNGFQDITVASETSRVEFDGSFNRGGDIIRLPGNATDYTVVGTGAFAHFSHLASNMFVPIGEAGTAIVFADRTLELVAENGVARIGQQAITSVPLPLTAAADGTTLPTGEVADARGKVFLAGFGEVIIGGDVDVAGTNSADRVHVLGGDVVLDGSFNRGGDMIRLDDAATTFKAHVSGANLVLVNDDTSLTIPVGTVGATIDFAGDVRMLKLAPDGEHISLRGQLIENVGETTLFPPNGVLVETIGYTPIA